MSARVSTSVRIASGLLIGVLAAGCGSGGMGSGYTAPMTTHAPTASFSQPAMGTSINFGQAVTVAWTSAYATSCSAMTSSAAGGIFTGNQSMSGTQTIVPTAPGSYTY